VFFPDLDIMIDDFFDEHEEGFGQKKWRTGPIQISERI